MDESLTVAGLDPKRWVDVHGDYLLRFAMARVRNREAAEELVQETLLAALSARDSFRGQATERSWLTAIMKRKVMDWLRRVVLQRARQEIQCDEWADGLFSSGGKWKTKPGDWSVAAPDQAMIRTEFWQTLARCLDKVPSRLRRAFVLRHLDEESVATVQSMLGVSAANVWVMLHRARLRLWRCMSVNWYDEATPQPLEGES